MNKILTTNYTGGFPLTNNDLEWLQNNITNEISYVLEGLNNSNDWILRDMYDNGIDTITSGLYVHDEGPSSINKNKIFSIDSPITYTNINRVWIVSDYTFDPNGNKLFKDGVSHNTWQIKKAKYIEQTSTPVGYDWYKKYVDVENERLGKTLTDHIFKKYNIDYFYNRLTVKYPKVWTNIVYNTTDNFSAGSGEPLKYTVDTFGNVNIRGFLRGNKNAGIANGVSAFNIPSEIRLNDEHRFNGMVTYMSYSDLAPQILFKTNGEVRIEVPTSTNYSGYPDYYGGYINITYSLD